jgi:hypothetical protein
MRIGNEQQFRWLRIIVAGILLLNVADAVLTVHWIDTGRAREGNVLLAGLAHHHPLVFVAAKLTLVSLGVLLLWRLRGHRLAVVALFVAFMAYYWLLIYHLQWLTPGPL